MPFDALRVAQAFRMGQEERQREAEMQQAAEDHDLNIRIKKQALEDAKLQRDLHLRQAAVQQFQLMGQIPGQTVHDVGPSNELPALGIPGQPNYMPAVPLGGTKVLPHPTISFPPVGDLPGFSGAPPTLQEHLQSLHLAELQAARAKLVGEVHAGSPYGLFTGTGEQLQAPTPEYTEKTIFQNDKPVAVLQDKQGNLIYQETRRPVVGAFTTKGPGEPTPPMSADRLQQEIDLMRQRAQLERDREEVPDPTDLLVQTSTGKQYVDAGAFTGKVANAIRTAASKQGINAPDKSTIEKIRSVDIARQNAQYMLRLIEDRLPKDASGRFIKGPANKLAELFQTDPVLAAIGTFRIAAIQQIQGLSTGPGLRINQAEIAAAQTNDIPKDTDTLETARQRTQNLLKFLETSENTFLPERKAGKVGGGPPPSNRPRAVDAKGNVVEFDGKAWVTIPK